MSKNDFLKVYVSALPSQYEGKALYPKERQNYVDNIKNAKQKNEIHFVWCLLEYAITKEFNVDFDKVNFEINSNGRWSCDICDFSLSHSDGAVAVAISSDAVGIDIEKNTAPKSRVFASRTLTEKELVEYKALGEEAKINYLIKTWTQKEAIFKSLNQESFIPKRIDTMAQKTFTEKISFYDGAEFFLSVFARNENAPIIEYVSDSKLTL